MVSAWFKAVSWEITDVLPGYRETMRGKNF